MLQELKSYQYFYKNDDGTIEEKSQGVKENIDYDFKRSLRNKATVDMVAGAIIFYIVSSVLKGLLH